MECAARLRTVSMFLPSLAYTFPSRRPVPGLSSSVMFLLSAEKESMSSRSIVSQEEATLLKRLAVASKGEVGQAIQQ